MEQELLVMKEHGRLLELMVNHHLYWGLKLEVVGAAAAHLAEELAVMIRMMSYMELMVFLTETVEQVVLQAVKEQGKL